MLYFLFDTFCFFIAGIYFITLWFFTGNGVNGKNYTAGNGHTEDKYPCFVIFTYASYYFMYLHFFYSLLDFYKGISTCATMILLYIRS